MSDEKTGMQCPKNDVCTANVFYEIKGILKEMSDGRLSDEIRLNRVVNICWSVGISLVAIVVLVVVLVK